MTGKVVVSIILVVLLGFAVLPVDCLASVATGDESAGGSLSAIFVQEVMDEEVPVGNSAVSMLGPICMLTGIFVLGASALRYAYEFCEMNDAVSSTMQNLERLIDASVEIDSTQSEMLHAEIDSLERECQQLTTQIQDLS